MSWPFATAIAPNVNATVTLGTTPNTVITANTEWHTLRRVLNNSGSQALVNITDAAGNYVAKNQPIEDGEQYPPQGQEGLPIEEMVGVKAWCNQASGVTFMRKGWT